MADKTKGGSLDELTANFVKLLKTIKKLNKAADTAFNRYEDIPLIRADDRKAARKKAYGHYKELKDKLEPVLELMATLQERLKTAEKPALAAMPFSGEYGVLFRTCLDIQREVFEREKLLA